MSNKNPTVEQVHEILESLKRYSDHELIQQILQETFGNDNEDKSSRAFQPSLTRDVNPTTQPSQQDEIV